MSVVVSTPNGASNGVSFTYNAPAPPPPPPPPPPPSSTTANGGFASAYTLLWGTDADLAKELDMLAATKARWLRFDIPWSVIEQTQGTYWWYPIDRLVTAAKARNFNLLATVAYTPAWARPAGTDDKTAPATTATRQAYGVFAAAAVARYATTINAYELWNEQNSTWFWKPYPDASGYAAMVHEASIRMRAVKPDVNIVLGGVAAIGPESGIDPEVYIHQLFDLGIAADVTNVGFHATSYPYAPDDPNTAAWNMMFRVQNLRNYLVSKGAGDKQLWLTEYGSPTKGYNAVPESTQAQHVVDVFAKMLSYGSWAGPVFWYTPRDKGTDTTDVDQNYGAIRRDWTTKPAYNSFVDIFSGNSTLLAQWNAAHGF